MTYCLVRYSNRYGTHVSTFSLRSYCQVVTLDVKLLFKGTKSECLKEELNYIPQSSSLTKDLFYGSERRDEETVY